MIANIPPSPRHLPAINFPVPNFPVPNLPAINFPVLYSHLFRISDFELRICELVKVILSRALVIRLDTARPPDRQQQADAKQCGHSTTEGAKERDLADERCGSATPELRRSHEEGGG